MSAHYSQPLARLGKCDSDVRLLKMYLTQKTKNIVVVGIGLVLTLFLTFMIFKLLDPTWDQKVTVNNTSVDVAFFTLFGGQALFGLAYLGFVIQGFRTHWAWGLANMLLPPVALAFFFAHTKQSKAPAIIYACGLVVIVLTMVWVNTR